MTRSMPLVSCHCITYGRNACLEEAIQFFLDQDYPGPKELVIVNDLPAQRLRFDHPDVRIFNLDHRFPNVGTKRNFSISECRGEVLVCWDDDDGYLPHHITSCARHLEGYDYARPDKCIVVVGDAQIERIANSFIAQHVFTREAFDRIGGYPDMNSGEDMTLDNKMRAACRCHWPNIGLHEITYLFRWANGHFHLSGFGPDKRGQKSGYEIIGEEIERKLAVAELPSGDIELKPHLKHDYYGMVGRFLGA